MKLDNEKLTPKACATVLETLEMHGYQPKNECRDGFCGSCRIKAKGKPQYVKDPLGYTQDGEILICCVSADSDIDIESSELCPIANRRCA